MPFRVNSAVSPKAVIDCASGITERPDVGQTGGPLPGQRETALRRAQLGEPADRSSHVAKGLLWLAGKPLHTEQKCSKEAASHMAQASL